MRAIPGGAAHTRESFRIPDSNACGTIRNGNGVACGAWRAHRNRLERRDAAAKRACVEDGSAKLEQREEASMAEACLHAV